uniref:histone acetyltransferase n=1 Tax=Albugo laibachii Nc14 TaxID=890382 RepID=F0W1U6_9STRA|nr:conserved hypothetical protein [Albugo laibachii Nc14]CCA23170.1 conserved hypothetical protein [Albugo laibachii Nc14]|eukprot:CCA23170.1 conserved hypothetical protein [Albugo laibachii Nc14]
MSAPIDDLLFGADDSGDEDALSTNVPVETYGTPLAPNGALPLSNPNTMPFPSSAAIPPPMSITCNTIPPRIIPAIGQNRAVNTSKPNTSLGSSTLPVTTASPITKPAGSGQQTFQQMFALLKQMLPPEQYATLHAEMRKGNGNDVKSIVDIIKRIAGDAIFSSVIQKMDIARTTGSNASIKPALPINNTTHNPAGLSRSNVSPLNVKNGNPQRSHPTQSSGMSGSSIKAEPIPLNQTPVPPANTYNAPVSVPISNPNVVVRNEAMEKIEFAKKLLLHASQCTLPPGMCQVKKCDDVRRVFRHSSTCGGARGCSHCEQLKGLVKYHAKECSKALNDRCVIPFCDTLRRVYANVSSANGIGTNMHAVDEDESSSLAKLKKQAMARGSKATTGISSPNRKSSSPGVNNASNYTTPKPKPVVNANITAEYGRLLQLILHVQKCSVTNCVLGEECSDSKALLCQINSPNAPDRAKTYKQVFAHYKVCLAKNNTSNCPMCKIGLRPIVTPMTHSPKASNAETTSTSTGQSGTSASAMGTSASPYGSSTKRPNASTPSSRSPTKKQRLNPFRKGSVSGTESSAGLDLAQASGSDLRREADVLTHTSVDFNTERRQMMDSRRRSRPITIAEKLSCKKEQWAKHDLFQKDVLQATMEAICQRGGVTLGKNTTNIMSFALYEHLKQSIEEMVEISKQRCDVHAQTLEEIKRRAQSSAASIARPLPSTNFTSLDVLRASCDKAFNIIRQDDLLLRTRLLEDAKRDEASEKERNKKRKKLDRNKQLLQDEKDEADMDLAELAEKDLKDRLLQEERDGLVKIEGRVNESISGKFMRCLDNQVTMEDASFWLHNQKPYVHPMLFLRADTARIITKALP